MLFASVCRAFDFLIAPWIRLTFFLSSLFMYLIFWLQGLPTPFTVQCLLAVLLCYCLFLRFAIAYFEFATDALFGNSRHVTAGFASL